jgi:hypothetical protein
MSGYLSVHSRPHVSTAVVSRALATGLLPGDLTFRSRGGESSSSDHSPWCVSRSIRWRGLLEAKLAAGRLDIHSLPANVTIEVDPLI